MAQWKSAWLKRPRGPEFEPHWCLCVVSLSKKITPSLVPGQPRKTRPLITERLLMGSKESNQRYQILPCHWGSRTLELFPAIISLIGHPSIDHASPRLSVHHRVPWYHSISCASIENRPQKIAWLHFLVKETTNGSHICPWQYIMDQYLMKYSRWKIPPEMKWRGLDIQILIRYNSLDYMK